MFCLGDASCARHALPTCPIQPQCPLTSPFLHKQTGEVPLSKFTSTGLTGIQKMEPPQAPTTSTTTPLPQPLSQDTRHAEMQARFRAQQEARMQSRKDSKAKDQLGKDPKESVGVFWTELRRAHEDVTRRLDTLALTDTSSISTNSTSSSSSSSSTVDETLANLGSKVQALDKQIADAALFLPPYDVRRAQEEATALRIKLEQVRTALAPRKKFSFSARRRAAGAVAAGGMAAAPVAAAGEAGAVDGSADGAGGKSISSSTKQAQSSTSSVAQTPSQTSTTTATATTGGSSELQAMEGFSYLSDATLNLNTLLSSSSSSTSTHPKDLLLRDLTRCTIHLLAPLHFLRLENLTDCKLLGGPVAGPVYLEKCQGCTLYLASRQLRIHHTYDTTLYVHTVSGPIIEDCDRLRFAPWGLTYPGWEEQFVEAGLRSKEEGGEGGREGGRNAWKEVKDFKWLRAQQSPHWSVVPEGERVREEVVLAVVEGGREGKEGSGAGHEVEEEEEEEEL